MKRKLTVWLVVLSLLTMTGIAAAGALNWVGSPMPKYWSYNYYTQPSPTDGLDWWSSATSTEQSIIANGGSCAITSLAMVFYPNTSSAGHASTPVGVYRQNGGLSAQWESLGNAYGYTYRGMIPTDGLV